MPRGRLVSPDAKGDQVEALRAPAEQAIRQWEFVPGSVDGKPAATETMLSVQFALSPTAYGSEYTNRFRHMHRRPRARSAEVLGAFPAIGDAHDD